LNLSDDRSDRQRSADHRSSVSIHEGDAELHLYLEVTGDQLTGTAKSDNGESKLTEGKVTGDEVTFVENLKLQDMDIRVTYKGKISGDQIKFTRNVGEFATEELTAKRAKKASAKRRAFRASGGIYER
jgi:major membrane immunogen (membrane-anchored lipoprotein)